MRGWLAIAGILAGAAGAAPIGADGETSGDAAGALRLRAKVVVDPEAWVWNWSSWDQEKILTFGRYQYTVCWDADRALVLVRRDLRDDGVKTLRLPQYKLSSNDRHRNTCLGASPADGRLHLSWDHHNNPLRYTRSRAGFLTDPPPELRASALEPAGPMLADPALESRVTYPRFFNDREGNLFLVYRTGASGNGNLRLHRYDPAAASWTRTGTLFSSRGTYPPWKDSTSRCAYLHDLVFDKANRLHASWVFRETGATWASNHDLHYATSDDLGATWRNNAGRKIADLAAGDPIELSDPGIVVREIPVFSWVMNAGCLAIDSRNRPHVVTYRSPILHRPDKLEHSPPEAIRRGLCFVHYWRSEDGTWAGGDPIQPGPLGVSRVDAVFDRRDDLYFFYPTAEGFRYFVGRAEDGWREWSGPRPLTGQEFTGRDASKHDRARWRDDGILTFTARAGAKGFAILDFAIGAAGTER
ncbi:MAG: BNR repeat-containing protein [Planctomycetes bacterium]|nr:BNR repeat-containing protein [Planctomycetota bacterium]